jgi:hypothetical protein
MNNRFVAFLGICFAGFMSGCSSLPFFGGGDKTAETPVEPSPAPAEQAAQPTEAETSESFPNPVIPAAPVAANPVLIPATNPAERLRAIQSGRPNPFNAPVVPFSIEPPEETPPPLPTTTTTNPSSPTRPNPSSLPTPVTFPNPTALPPAPSLPNPTLARAVVVTGVVQVGSTLQAIVRAPLEITSRYVTVGQRIANGQVLVKRIEMRGSEPVVVFEQLGVEVSRSVGEPVEALAPAPGSPEAPGTAAPGNAPAVPQAPSSPTALGNPGEGLPVIPVQQVALGN